MQKKLIVASLTLIAITSFADWEFTKIDLNGSQTLVLRDTDQGWAFKASPLDSNYGIQVGACIESPTDGRYLDFTGDITNNGSGLPNLQMKIRKIHSPFNNRWTGASNANATNLTSIIFPDTLEVIGEFAFWNCTNLTYISSFPSTILEINRGAFENSALACDIDISEGNCDLGYCAFANTKVTTADLSGVTSIGSHNSYSGVFENCKSLTSVTLNNSITSIPTRAFKNCSMLTTVSPMLPSGLLNVGEQAFYNTALAGELSFESDCMLSAGAFAKTKLTAVDLSNTTNVLGVISSSSVVGVFEDCGDLQSIILPEDLTSIGNNTFYNCTNLVSITPMFPDTLEAFGANAFGGVTFPEQPLYLRGVKTIGASVFANQPITEVYFGACLTNIVGGWEKGAFFNCTKLAKVEFPKKAAPCTFGEMTFAKCSSLTELELPAKTVGRYIITGSGVTNITYRACLEKFSEKIYTVAYGSQKLTDVYYYGPCPTIDETVKIFYGINAGKLTHHVNETYLSTWAAVTDDGEAPDSTSKWITNEAEMWIRPWRPVENTTLLFVR